MKLTCLRSSFSEINNKTKDYTYLILLLAVGVLTVYESMRISSKYVIKDWLSGPSGFVMIVGCGIMFLALVEVVSIIKNRRRKLHHLSHSSSSSATLISSPDEMSGEELKPAELSANMIFEEDRAKEKQHNMRNLILSYALLIVYVITIKPLGFTISTAMYMTLNLRLLKNSWLLTIVTVITLILCTMYGAPAMGLSLPRGILGF